MPAAPFLAMITPLGDSQPQPPLGIWGPSDPRPTNPIAGWDPGTGNFPKPQPPQPPLVIWGPGDPRPTLPIAGWDPGSGAFPPGGGSGPPLGTWGGAGQPFPTNPIAEPPWGWGNPPPEIPIPPDILPERKVDWKYGWTAQTGWIVVGIPIGNVPTPSK